MGRCGLPEINRVMGLEVLPRLTNMPTLPRPDQLIPLPDQEGFFIVVVMSFVCSENKFLFHFVSCHIFLTIVP